MASRRGGFDAQKGLLALILRGSRVCCRGGCVFTYSEGSKAYCRRGDAFTAYSEGGAELATEGGCVLIAQQMQSLKMRKSQAKELRKKTCKKSDEKPSCPLSFDIFLYSVIVLLYQWP